MKEINNNLKEELTKMLTENQDMQKFVIQTIQLLQKNGKIEEELSEERIEELCLSIMMQMLDVNLNSKKEE